MPAHKVDIVFCLDTSDSMQPCIDRVRENITALTGALRQANFEWRIDFVTHNMPGKHVYNMESVYGNTVDMLYQNENSRFFTTDLDLFRERLQDQDVEGDEDMLCALDTALDMPFGPANITQRVIVLISDEPFRTNEPEAFERSKTKVPDILKKIMDRHITLFGIMPIDDIAEELASADRADFTPADEGDAGLAGVNLKDLFRQFGKTISVQTAQGNGSESYDRALFDQNQWGNVSEFDHIGDAQ